MSSGPRRFSRPDQGVTECNNAHMVHVNVGGQRVIKITLKPGWKWSNDVKPQIGTDSCQATHTGVIMSGKICARMDDGTEIKYSAGDAYHEITLGKNFVLSSLNLAKTAKNLLKLPVKLIFFKKVKNHNFFEIPKIAILRGSELKNYSIFL